MDVKISQSTNPYDYEVLIRKQGNNNYSSYCPQLNLMLTGAEHVEVQKAMEAKVLEHIEKLTKN
jgi:hypothetical protein